MLKFLIPCFLVSFVTFEVTAQDINGHVTNKSDNTPLAYVNIGVIGKGQGTASDTLGRFTLRLGAGLEQDSVRISMIGFTPQTFSVPDFRKLAARGQIQIQLDPAIVQMEEVYISGRKLQKKRLGNTSQSKFYTIGFSSDQLGNELATRIKIKRPARLLAFHAFIVDNTYGKVQFRLKIYNIKDGVPTRLIIKDNIYVETDIKAGPLQIDLRPYDITCDQDIAVSLEWIEDLEVGDLHFSASLFGNPAFFRTASQGNWEKSGTFTVGFSVDVEQ